ncbi:MAG: CopG family transcriptional regulator [Nitrospinae bacterium]|nr:CopG family transcriptional regulator [Nitrospinota bacterium]
MSSQMVIRMETQLKQRLARLARMEGKTTSRMIREVLESHIKERDIASYIDDLWSRIGKRLKDRGATVHDVEKAIRAVRKGDK